LQVVPAGRWQAARTTGDYSLVGCTVAPGFEFDDYRLFEPGGSELTQLKQLFPTWPAR
jgi:predicted cupin superfamily sugar epimerase